MLLGKIISSFPAVARQWFWDNGIRYARDGRWYYCTKTDDSPKWKAGHTVGCCFHAPVDQCICEEIKEEAAKYSKFKVPLPELSPYAVNVLTEPVSVEIIDPNDER